MESARLHLKRLFSPYADSPDLRIELRCLCRSTGEVIQNWYPIDPGGQQCVCNLALLWREEVDVYIGALPRIGRGDRDHQVAAAAWLFVDLDVGNQTGRAAGNLLRQARIGDEPLPNPALAVSSGSGGHLYWPLPEPVPLETPEARKRFTCVLRRLCRAIGGNAPGAHADTACTNPSRILRLAETLNHKSDPPRPVKIQTIETEPRSLEWWEARLPMERQTRLFQPVGDVSPRGFFGGPSAGLEAWAEQPIPEGQRHRKLCGHARWLKRECNLSEPEAYSLFLQKVAASNRDAQEYVDEKEAQAMWNWA